MRTSEYEWRTTRAAIEVIGDRWSLLILNEFLEHGARRFLDLQEYLGISPNTLSARLRRMQSAGLIERRQYSQSPPRSEYHLTEKGARMAPVIDAIRDWACDNMRQ
ncbi:transcriptional regulator [Roseovarius spongiae]|uniref:Transcriptional regulator n=2 Tax=Roseovarius spongiae TaxID=2320272 RepID=A0A3A8ATP6_9RHOB|nr:transcriptional regulator [Roseovarius spongiae]